jgi:hypothetical protein
MVVDVYGRWCKYTCSCIISLHHEHMHRASMSICIKPGWWESNVTFPKCSWARLVRKLYDYFGVLLWIMSLTYGHDRTGTASYIARGGVPLYMFLWCFNLFVNYHQQAPPSLTFASPLVKLNSAKLDQELLQCFHTSKVHMRSIKKFSSGLEWTDLTFKLTYITFNHGAS